MFAVEHRTRIVSFILVAAFMPAVYGIKCYGGQCVSSAYNDYLVAKTPEDKRGHLLGKCPAKAERQSEVCDANRTVCSISKQEFKGDSERYTLTYGCKRPDQVKTGCNTAPGTGTDNDTTSTTCGCTEDLCNFSGSHRATCAVIAAAGLIVFIVV